MGKLTASVIGAGFGGGLSIDALARSDKFELKAVSDLRPEVGEELRKTHPDLQTFTRHEEMFDQAPTDVVCISTWPPSHRPLALEAMEKLPLKGILVEKPLGDTAAAGREILQEIKRRRLPVAVPHGLLANAGSQAVLASVEAGAIGQLALVEVECSGWDIINAGIHWANFFVRLTRNEPIAYVMAALDKQTRTYRDGMQVETLAVTYAQTDSGVRLIMQTGDHVKTLTGHGTLFRLIGDRGVIHYPAWSLEHDIFTADDQGVRHVKAEPHQRSAHQIHLEAMADQVAAGKPDYTVADSSLIALEICEAAFIAARHGCQVTFPLEQFTPPAPNDWQPGQPYRGTGGGRDGRKL